MKNFLIVVCLGMIGTFAAAQNSSSSNSSNASDCKSSLNSTLKRIQDRVNDQGEIRFTMSSKSTVNGEMVQDEYVAETTNAITDANSCTLQVDVRMILNGKIQAQGRPVIQFRGIDFIIVKVAIASD